jgi:hypothetical protein
MSFSVSRSQAPLSVLSDISPARGEIARVTAFLFLIASASKRETGDTANLPPCGGDVRQDRGGRRTPNLR